MALASLALLVLLGLAAWLRPWQPTVEVASVERMAFPLPDKSSLAVLPFKSKGGGPEQDHFVDGLTDDLITDLSKVSGLFIIARDSVFPFKGHDAKVREVAESLGVRYVVDGSARRAGSTVRVNVRLIDALTGGQLWAERYDGNLDDIFAVQDQMVRVIVDALALKLSIDEERQIGRGQTNNIHAREAFQKGWERILRFMGGDNLVAIAELRRAIELDPDYGRAYSALGLALFRSCSWGWAHPDGMNRFRTCELATKYLDEAQRHPSSMTHVVAAHFYLNYLEYDTAFTEAARVLAEALQCDPAATELAPPLAATYAHLGRRKEAREMLLRWQPGASQEELDNIVLQYPYTICWSSDGQRALERPDNGMMIAAMPLDITVPALVLDLRRGGAFERARTARTLARFGPQAADAVPALVRALDDPSRVVRGAAIAALGKIGAKAKVAVPALRGIQDPELRPLADGAVKEIGGS